MLFLQKLLCFWEVFAILKNMASKMLSKKFTKPSAPCDSSSQTTELQTKVKKLQAELEAERLVAQ